MFDCSGTYGDSDANIHLFLEYDDFLRMKRIIYNFAKTYLTKWKRMS